MKQRVLLILHRRMGLVSALFVIMLALTGLVLHYSVSLRLDASYVNSSALVRWYGIEVPGVAVAFAADGRHLAQLEDALYFDDRRLPGSFISARGLLRTDFGFVAAATDRVILLTETGELVEVLGGGAGVPGPISRLGRGTDGRLYLEVRGVPVRADLDALEWTVVERPAGPIAWSAPVTLPASLTAALRADFTARLLTWERILLDIHSGRILGGVGVILVDIMAVLFLLMAVTGVWIWSRRRS